jgi:hypothetical protein
MLVENDEEILTFFQNGFQEDWKEFVLKKLTGVQYTKQRKLDFGNSNSEEPKEVSIVVEEPPLRQDSGIMLDFAPQDLSEESQDLSEQSELHPDPSFSMNEPDATMDITPEPRQEEETLAFAYVKQQDPPKKRTKKSPVKNSKEWKVKSPIRAKEVQRSASKVTKVQKRFVEDSTTEDEMLMNNSKKSKSKSYSQISEENMNESNEDSEDSVQQANVKMTKKALLSKKPTMKKLTKKSEVESSVNVPAAVVGTTRSGRNVLKPLEWWRNEKYAS